jgi:hypothetical protein
MNDLLRRITVNPAQCGGRPCVRGMRIRVTDVLDLLAQGLSTEQILAEMPDLEAGGHRGRIAVRRTQAQSPDPGRMRIWVDAQLSPHLAPWLTERFGVVAGTGRQARG